MLIIDFLFYYTAIYFEKLNTKYGVKLLESSRGARNLIYISTFLWFLYFVVIFNFIVYDEINYSIPWYRTLTFSIILYEALTIEYINRKRFQKIQEREQSSNSKFKITEKIGIIIAATYIYTGMAGIFVGFLIYHFMVYRV